MECDDEALSPGPLQESGEDPRADKRPRARLPWLLSEGFPTDPFCGCPYDKSPTVLGVHIGALDSWKLPNR